MTIKKVLIFLAGFLSLPTVLALAFAAENSLYVKAAITLVLGLITCSSIGLASVAIFGRNKNDDSDSLF